MAIGKEAQLIAAINAFAHFFDILMEPSIAFHELARREGNEAALLELAWFRTADHGNKFDWLEVALGRAECLAHPEEIRALESHDLAAGLRDWSTGYGAVLKLAEIELLHPGAPIGKMMVLLEWMHRDYFFAGHVATMACVYFAPINAPKARLMKSLRSPNREKAIAGAKNAAWDALYPHEVMVENRSRIVVLGSSRSPNSGAAQFPAEQSCRRRRQTSRHSSFPSSRSSTVASCKSQAHQFSALDCKPCMQGIG